MKACVKPPSHSFKGVFPHMHFPLWWLYSNLRIFLTWTLYVFTFSWDLSSWSHPLYVQPADVSELAIEAHVISDGPKLLLCHSPGLVYMLPLRRLTPVGHKCVFLSVRQVNMQRVHSEISWRGLPDHAGVFIPSAITNTFKYLSCIPVVWKKKKGKKKHWKELCQTDKSHLTCTRRS